MLISRSHNCFRYYPNVSHLNCMQVACMANNKPSGSHPVCDSHINGTQHDEKGHQLLYLWCSISYTGNANPVSSWTKSSKQQNITTNTNWTTTSGSIKGPLTSTSSTKEQLHSNDSGAVFQYRITFRMLDRNTIKDFEYTWNYTLCKQSTNIIMLSSHFGASIILKD